MKFLRTTTAARRVAVMGAVAAAVLLPASAAWAPHVPQLLVNPAQARAGDQVSVEGARGFGFTNPVEVHFNAPDGPVLGRFQPDTQTYAAWGPGTITIPADARPGTYTLYATQVLAENESHIRGIPARASLDVIAVGGTPVLGAPKAVPGDPGIPLATKEPRSIGSLLLLGAGVGGAAMFLAGLATVVTGSRRPSKASEAAATR